MDTTPTDAAASSEEREPSLSPIERTVAVFARPAGAWVGLGQRAQWWFPILIVVAFTVAATALLHHRALVPMMAEEWDRQVAAGQLPAERAAQIETFFSSPAGMGLVIGQQAIFLTLLTFVVALLIWFGVGFVLGTRMTYRLSLEVAAWSSLITLPAHVLGSIQAWLRESMRGIHVGFGILLGDPDPPTKAHVALGVLLDALGPLSIWYLVVLILGASALSGAPRKSAAWTLGVVYLAVTVFMAGMAALFTPTS